MTEKTPSTPEKSVKRPYAKPAVVHYGDVVQLTQTAGTGYADNNQNNCNHNRPNTNTRCGSLG